MALAPSSATRSLTRFVGREAILEELSKNFAAGQRLLTLTGPGGIGKTRLATEYLERHPQRGTFIDLTESRDEAAVISRIAQDLEVFANPGTVLREVLGHALAGRGPMLLVLDNMEQVVADGARVVTELLRSAPALSLLVTSRECLHLSAEVVLTLPPLSLPVAGKPVQTCESVVLLLDRARRRKSDLTVRTEDEGLLASLVAHLDGNPLAIELAASRLPLLGLKALLARMSERFSALGTGVRDGSDKSRTLHAAIDWSWQLLDEDERAALAQISVFRGGFDLEAAEEVLATQRPVLDVLASLHDKSLLRSDASEGEGQRFGLYSSIRDFAAVELSKRADAAATSERHALHYLAKAAEAAPHVRTGDATHKRTLLREQENLAAIVDKAEHRERALAAALCLEPVFSLVGPFESYAAMLDRALSLPGDDESPLVLEALLVRGNLNRQSGRPEMARRDLEEALQRAHGEEHGAVRARALAGLATVELVQGELLGAKERYELALSAFAGTGDRWHEAMAMSAYGAALAGLGDVDGAERVETEALAQHQALKNLRDVGMTSAFLGNLAIDVGRVHEARLFLADAAAIHDQLGDRFGQAFTTANLGIVDQRQQAFDAARRKYDEAIRAFTELGARRYAGAFVGYRALVDAEQGELSAAEAGLSRATQMLAAAQDERFEALFRAHLAVVRRRLGGIESAQLDIDAALASVARSSDPFLACAVSLLQIPSLIHSSSDHEEITQARFASAEEREDDGRARVDQSADVYFALRAVRAALGQSFEAPLDLFPMDALVVHPDGEWIRPPHSARVKLNRRDVLRRLLNELVSARARTPGRSVGRDSLLAAMWPGERILKGAAHNRLRVAVATLRKLGLQQVLLTDDDGYRLDETISLISQADAQHAR